MTTPLGQIRSCSPCPTIRAAASFEPPAGFGTTIRTGRSGNFCAAAAPPKLRTSSAANASFILTISPPSDRHHQEDVDLPGIEHHHPLLEFGSAARERDDVQIF